MAELQDITGLGPAREESLADVGYETVADLVDADPEELAEEVGISDDKALDFIVQAQNMVEDGEDDESDADDGQTITEEIEDELDDEDETGVEGIDVDEEDETIDEADDSDDSDEEDVEEDPVYSCEIEFDTMLEYDTFHAALMRQWEQMYTSSQPSANAMKSFLDKLDNFDGVEYEMDQAEFNELHSAVHKQRINYQGDNLITHMEALREIERQVNEQREDQLF